MVVRKAGEGVIRNVARALAACVLAFLMAALMTITWPTINPAILLLTVATLGLIWLWPKARAASRMIDAAPGRWADVDVTDYDCLLDLCDEPATQIIPGYSSLRACDEHAPLVRQWVGGEVS